MKSAALIAISGIACGVASAGIDITLIFDADGDMTTQGPLAVGPHTWTVYASFTGLSTTGYFGGFVGEFRSSGEGTVSDWTNLMAGTGTTPIADGGNWTNINIFNNALLGTDDPSNPIAIATFESEVGPGFRFSSVEGTAALFFDSNIFTQPLFAGPPQITVLSDFQIPTPGVAAVMGLGGVVISRRRR
jgi:hypothetical protein